MKERILRMLREHNEYVSGQQICQELGVTRSAIWKVMNQLKEEGYVIEAVSNKGYVLKDSPDSVTEHEIKSQLAENTLLDAVVTYDAIDSTNNKAKELACDHKENMLIVSDTQLSGRGSKGRAWDSPSGTGIWMSFLMHPSIAPLHASRITLITALAVAKAIEEESGMTLQIKWPNDILLHNKKLCGILTEMNSEIDFIHYVIVGIGINVHTTDFPIELSKIATSLALEGARVKRSSLICKIVKYFDRYYNQFLQTEDLSAFTKEYNALLIHKDKPIRVISLRQEQEGIARGIDASGSLLLELPDGSTQTVISGEVSVRGLQGYV